MHVGINDAWCRGKAKYHKMEGNMDIAKTVEERDVNHWNLLLASFLGECASFNFFNQAILNMLLKRSLTRFIIPYLEHQGDDKKMREKIAASDTAMEKIRAVVDTFNDMFGLNGSIEVTQQEGNCVAISADSGRCRLCPVGVGNAQLKEGQTLCPFPQFMQEVINHYVAGQELEIVKTVSGGRVTIVEKTQGLCTMRYQPASA
jgi:hypothetical protein